MRTQLAQSIVLGAALATLCSTVQAQESGPPDITTERPTAGPSPDVIPAHTLQFENGLQLSIQRKQLIADAPETLVRLGLSNHVELRFLTSDALYQSSNSPHRFETADAALSTKILISGPNSPLPKTAIVALSFPTGTEGITSGSYDPTLSAIWTQAGRRYFLNEVAQSTLSTFSGARRATWSPSIAGGRALTETFALFAEYAPFVLPDHTRPYEIDGGVIFTLHKTHQIDLRSGYLKDAQGTHTLVSFGYSRRFDHLWGHGQEAEAPHEEHEPR